jgi:hypothetical protein
MGLEYGQSVAVRKRAFGRAMRLLGTAPIPDPGDPLRLSKFGQFDKRMPADRASPPRIVAVSLAFAGETSSPTKKARLQQPGLNFSEELSDA